MNTQTETSQVHMGGDKKSVSWSVCVVERAKNTQRNITKASTGCLVTSSGKDSWSGLQKVAWKTFVHESSQMLGNSWLNGNAAHRDISLPTHCNSTVLVVVLFPKGSDFQCVFTHACYGLDVNCPSQSEHLVSSWWHCFGRLWNL